MLRARIGRGFPLFRNTEEKSAARNWPAARSLSSGRKDRSHVYCKGFFRGCCHEAPRGQGAKGLFGSSPRD